MLNNVVKQTVRAHCSPTTCSIRSHHFFAPSIFLRKNVNKEKRIPSNPNSPVKHDIPKHWSETFASDSESIIKAELSKEESIEELQEETIEHMKQGPPTTNHNSNKIPT